jgi:phosphonoacetaldehyde hydrolase
LGGTIVDRYSFTPLLCIQRAFKGNRINVTGSMIRKDMGLSKEDHINKLFEDKNIQKQWDHKYHQRPTKGDKLGLLSDFKVLLERETKLNMKVLPHTAKCISKLRKDNIVTGVTTGFDLEQMERIKWLLESENIFLDSYVSSTCLNKPGRPEPHMIFENMARLKIDDPRRLIKIDDTVSGIQEGLNADCWTVAVSRWSSNMNVNSKEEIDQLENLGNNNNYYQLRDRINKSRKILESSGAHYVINTLAELPSIIDDINDMRTPIPKNLN